MPTAAHDIKIMKVLVFKKLSFCTKNVKIRLTLVLLIHNSN